MADFRLEIKGVNRVGNKMRKLASFHPEITNPVGKQWAQNKSKQLRKKAYPAERPGQRYIRTGRLGKGWRAMNPKPGQWSILNTTKYASFVVGDTTGKGQAWMHRGRWWTARKEIEKSTPTLTQALAEALQELINE